LIIAWRWKKVYNAAVQVQEYFPKTDKNSDLRPIDAYFIFDEEFVNE
jgi:hypothetical protein